MEQGVKITMAVNPATIGLLNAETANENLKSCAFTFFRPTSSGTSQKYFEIVLTNAQVVSYSLSGSPTSGTSTSFTFIAQKIERIWVIGGKTSVDNWAAPVG